MKADYYKEYSRCLGRDMEYKVYGDRGKPCLVFPSQNGRFYDFENFNMLEPLEYYIENGQLQVICADSIDGETWSSMGEEPREKIELHEKWYDYIMTELIPAIKKRNPDAWDRNWMTMGCSMGAFHAGNFFFRRPDIFSGVLALSGTYDASMFAGSYMDELVYFNSPKHSLSNLPWDHYYRKLFAESRIVLCVGQGEWEDELLAATRDFEQVLRRQQISAWVDYWGMDVSHDWDWWRKQVAYFIVNYL